MAAEHLVIPVGRLPLSDEVFKERVVQNFLGDVVKGLSLELHDVSNQHEAEALALVVEFPKRDSPETNERLVFRVDRQSLEHLTNSLDGILKQQAVGLQAM